MIAMRLLIDMDGVIADFLGHWCHVFNTRYQRNIQPTLIRTWRMDESVPDSTREACEDLIWEPGFFLHPRPIPGAIEAIERLHQAGHEIVFVTSCLAGHTDKLTWLKRHFNFPIRVVFTSEKYLVKGDVLIDDYPVNLTQWQAEWPDGLALCFAAPYNEQWQGVRAHDWTGVEILLNTLEAQV
jgi:5'(3')-deoxyribonucleotidase